MIQYTTKKDGARVANTYIDGVKSAIQIEGDRLYLMSHCAKWDGTRPVKMHGWKYGREIGIVGAVNIDDKDGIMQLVARALDKHIDTITCEGEDEYAAIRAKVEEHAAARRAAKESTPAPVPTTETESAPDPAPATETESKPAPAVNVPTMDAASAALAGLFGGVTNNVVSQVMAQINAKLEPILKAAPVVHEYKIIRIDGTTHKTSEHYHEKFNKVVQSVSMGEYPYLYGPAGSGKSEIARQVAEALGLSFYMQSCITETFTLSGFKDANGTYQASPFYKAFKDGGLFLLDEMDACLPDVLTNLNQALANGYYSFAGEVVKANENFHMIGTGNTALQGATSEYNTRYQMDKATIDRFDPIFVDYDSDVEKVIANGNNEALEYIHDMRNSSRAAGVDMILGYRAIGKLCKLTAPAVADVFGDEALQMAVLKGMQIDEINILYNGLVHKENRYAKMMKALCA